MIDNVIWKHVGFLGKPGVGKDTFYTALYLINQRYERTFGTSRPFEKVQRIALADRIREIASWITNEDYKLYLHHPFKDKNVQFGTKEVDLSRRDFMIQLGKFIEKKIDSDWVLERTKLDLDNLLRDVVASAEWQIELGQDPEEALLKALSTMKPHLFVTTDIRQLSQYEWVKNNPNGILIRISNKDNKRKGRLNKIEKILDDLPADIEVEWTDYFSFQNEGSTPSPNPDRFAELLATIKDFKKA